MLIKLDDENKLFGGRIDKGMVKGMVKQYRGKPAAKKLNYAHFNVEEVIQLLVDNKAISAGALGHIIPGHGIKIYIGQHNHKDNCPAGRENDYMKCDTSILCVTSIIDEAKFLYADKLVNKKDSILISGSRIDPAGNALDQSSTYPPDNPNIGGTDDTYDVGV